MWEDVAHVVSFKNSVVVSHLKSCGRMHNALVLSLSAYDSNVLSAIVRNLHHKAPYKLHTFTHIHLSHKRLCYAQIAL